MLLNNLISLRDLQSAVSDSEKETEDLPQTKMRDLRSLMSDIVAE